MVFLPPKGQLRVEIAQAFVQLYLGNLLGDCDESEQE